MPRLPSKLSDTHFAPTSSGRAPVAPQPGPHWPLTVWRPHGCRCGECAVALSRGLHWHFPGSSRDRAPSFGFLVFWNISLSMLLVFLSDFPLIVFNILPATGMQQASLAHGQLGILTRPVVEGRLGRPRPRGDARWLRIQRHASTAGIWLYDSFCLFFSPVVHTIQEAPQLTVPKIVGLWIHPKSTSCLTAVPNRSPGPCPSPTTGKGQWASTSSAGRNRRAARRPRSPKWLSVRGKVAVARL